MAIPAIRLRGIYLALATFAFGLLMENLVYRTFLLFGNGTAKPVTRPDLPGVDLSTDKAYFYVAVGIAVATALVFVVLQRSRLGRILRALADSPTALQTFGNSATTTLVLVFCISAFFAGVAGAVLSARHARGGDGRLRVLQLVGVDRRPRARAGRACSPPP